MRIGVLSNTRAGRGVASLGRVRGVVQRHPDLVHVETRSADRVDDALGVLAGEGVELLVLNGGDGTLQRALTRILGSKRRDWLPMVAPLRGGRTNTSALSFGVQRDPARGLSDLIDAVRAGTLHERIDERPVVRADLGSAGVQYGLFFGAGMLYRAIVLTHGRFSKRRAGYLGAITTTSALIGRAILGRFGGVLTPEKLSLALDRSALPPQESLIFLATTLDRLFLRMRPWWGREPFPLRVTAIGGRPKGVRTYWSVLRGRPPAQAASEASFLSRNVREARVRLDGGMTVDGELYAPEPGRVVRLSADDRVRFVRA